MEDMSNIFNIHDNNDDGYQCGYTTNNFQIFKMLPAEIISRITQYLIEPQFKIYVDKRESNDDDDEFVVLSLNFEYRIFMPSMNMSRHNDNNSDADECVHSMCISHNINFTDSLIIREFTDNIKNNREAIIIWDVPRYSLVQQNVLIYTPAKNTSLKSKLTSQIYQHSHEQYYPPSPALQYNVDVKHGRFKTTDATFSLSYREKLRLVEQLAHLINLIDMYA